MSDRIESQTEVQMPIDASSSVRSVKRKMRLNLQTDIFVHSLSYVNGQVHESCRFMGQTEVLGMVKH
jgi:hypothetical protein